MHVFSYSNVSVECVQSHTAYLILHKQDKTIVILHIKHNYVRQELLYNKVFLIMSDKHNHLN